jgi:hypothetical protein
MKNLIMMLDDLWVAITFAEAGISEAAAMNDPQPQYHDDVRVQTA